MNQTGKERLFHLADYFDYLQNFFNEKDMNIYSEVVQELKFYYIFNIRIDEQYEKNIDQEVQPNKLFKQIIKKDQTKPIEPLLKSEFKESNFLEEEIIQLLWEKNKQLLEKFQNY